MVILYARIVAAFVVLLAAFAVRPVLAADDLHGVVVSVLAAQNEAVVRHEPFGGMPGMTMLFRIAPKGVAARLHQGDRIEARVQMEPDGGLLERVRVVGTQTDNAAPVLHDVQPLNVGDSMPLTPFFDQLGPGFTFIHFRGKTVVLAFIYTRCREPRMCPLVSANFHILQRKLADLPVHLVEITLDRGDDTPKVLANYGQRFDADPDRWTLGTGPQNVVNDFAARFGIAVFADPTTGLIHSERTVIIDRNGNITDLLDAAAWNPDDAVARIRALSEVPSNPIARLDYELSKASAALCGNNLAGYSGLLDLALVVMIIAGA